jgi:hypothetical protein
VQLKVPEAVVVTVDGLVVCVTLSYFIVIVLDAP